MASLSHYACGHCKGFGFHENTPAHVCIACQRTGLLPLDTDDNFPMAFPSKKSKEIYNRCVAAALNPSSTSLQLLSSLSTSSPIPSTIFQTTNKDFKVVVAGLGIAGAAFTLALQHRGIQVISFERDTHFNQRAQGYGLTLQQGGAAVRALGISCQENNSSLAITKHNAWSHTGDLVGSYGSLDEEEIMTETHKKKKAPKHNIIITRQDLRSKMVQNILPNTINWGISVIGYTEQDNTPSSLLTVHLSNGEKVEDCALLVGCDGIRSSIRNQKLQMCMPLRFLNVFVILGLSSILSDDVEDENYKQRTFVNQASDGCTRIYSMPFDHKTIMWQLSFPIESEEVAFRLQETGPEGWLVASKRRCSHWNLPYMAYMLLNTPVKTVTGYPAYDRSLPTPTELRFGSSFSAVPQPQLQFKEPSPSPSLSSAPTPTPTLSFPLFPKTTLPTITQIETIDPSASKLLPHPPLYHSTLSSNKRVTLLGDAMHPCSPFKAQGANQALLDAISCARAITTLLLNDDLTDKDTFPTIDELDCVLSQFEQEMLQRTTPKVLDSRNHIALLHSLATLAPGNAPRAHVAKTSLEERGEDSTLVEQAID